MIDIQRARGMMWWWVPLAVGIIALCVWTSIDDVPRMYKELNQQSPSLRIRIGSLLMPIGAFMFAACLVLAPLRIWRLEGYAARVEKYLVIGSMILFFIALPIVLIGGRILQQTYLPRMGYSECSKLNGAPSVYFTDWVKDPAWCIYKKDHAWVREQAANADSVKSQPSR